MLDKKKLAESLNEVQRILGDSPLDDISTSSSDKIYVFQDQSTNKLYQMHPNKEEL